MRVQIGEKNNNAKLTERQVADAKGYLIGGLSLFQVQEITHIDRRNLWAIRNNKSWKNIEPNLEVIFPNLKKEWPTEKQCPTCLNLKPLKFFSNSSRGPLFVKSQCKQCTSERSSQARKVVRQSVIEKYGGECSCCGEKIIE